MQAIIRYALLPPCSTQMYPHHAATLLNRPVTVAGLGDLANVVGRTDGHQRAKAPGPLSRLAQLRQPPPPQLRQGRVIGQLVVARPQRLASGARVEARWEASEIRVLTIEGMARTRQALLAALCRTSSSCSGMSASRCAPRCGSSPGAHLSGASSLGSGGKLPSAR